MSQLIIDLPEEVLAALGLTLDEANREARRILAVRWFGEGRITQGTGARIAGLSRHDFLDLLSQAKVPAIQITADELREEVDHGAVAGRQREPIDSSGEGAVVGASRDRRA